MNTTNPHELLDRVMAVSAGCADRGAVESALAAISRLGAMIEAQRLRCAAALRALSSTPAVDLARSGRTNLREGGDVMRRLQVTERAREMAGALRAGDVSIGHVDALGRALHRLNPEQQRQLLATTDALVDVAVATSPERFAEHLRRVEWTLVDDNAASARLARQRGLVRLTSWVDGEDGMHHWKLALDPVSGVQLAHRIRTATEELFHGGQLADGAPLDPVHRQQFLQAHALLGMLDGRGGGSPSRPMFVTVVDARNPDAARPVVDWGMPVDIPRSAVVELAARADHRTVALDGARVVTAPGRLDRGREARLATLDQRVVLRALFATCAVPECAAPFDVCIMHHVDWWEAGGATDLANLAPLCSAHHHAVHDDGWRMTIEGHHQIAFDLPDGRRVRAGPNRGRGQGPGAAAAQPALTGEKSR